MSDCGETNFSKVKSRKKLFRRDLGIYKLNDILCNGGLMSVDQFPRQFYVAPPQGMIEKWLQAIPADWLEKLLTV